MSCWWNQDGTYFTGNIQAGATYQVTLTAQQVAWIAVRRSVPRWWFPAALGLVAGLLALGPTLGM